MQKFLSTIVLFLQISLNSNAAILVETQSFADIQSQVEELVKKHTAIATLVVLDLDNTLLAMSEDLGSDQWFDWQSTLLGTKDTDAVASNFNGLLEVQTQINSIRTMRLTEPSVLTFMKYLKDNNIPALILTSRGPEMRDSTLKELSRNGLGVFNPTLSRTATILPYNLQDPEASCLTAQEAQQWKLSAARPIAIHENVILSSGLHKGAILRNLLCGKRAFNAIVFVDDKVKNTKAVADAYDGPNPETVVFRYGKEDSRVKAFHGGTKDSAKAHWKQLQQVINPTAQ